MGLVPLLSILFLAAGLGVLARSGLTLYRALPLARRNGGVRPRRHLLAGLLGVLVGLTTASVGTAGLSLVFAFSDYSPFTQKDLVAEVRCFADEGSGGMVLRYTPITPGGPGPEEVYHLAGDQWAIGGEIVKWRPLVAFLGARTLYKVSRIEGRYLRAQDAVAGARTAFDVNGGPDPALLRWNEREGTFPYSLVVEAAYGNLSYDFPKPRAVYAVYVTPSGFQIEKN